MKSIKAGSKIYLTSERIEMTPTPDREAFLRRLEQQQQQQQEKKSPEELLSTKSAELKDNTCESPRTQTMVQGDDELLQYLNQQCGILDISIEDFDGSSLDLLRQFRLDGKINLDIDSEAKPPERTSEEGNSTSNNWFQFLQDAKKRFDPLSENKKSPPNESDHESQNKHLRTMSGITSRESSSSNETVELPEEKNHVESLPPALNTYLSSSTSPDWQKQLLELLDHQNKVLRNTRNQIESLEKQVQHLQTLLLQTPSGTPTLTTELPPDQSPPPVQEGIFHLLQAKLNDIKDSIPKTRTARAVRLAFGEARRQNIHQNLDVYLFFRMIFFIFMFGGRNTSQKAKDSSFFDQYRLPIFVLVAGVLYLLQTGVIQFLYTFFTKDLQRLEAQEMEEEHRVPQDNGEDHHPLQNPRQRNEDGRIPQGIPRELHEGGGNMEDDLAGNQGPIHPNENGSNDNPPNLPRYLTDGGINNDGGVLNDMKYFLGSFLLSLIPTWKPVKVEDEHSHSDANEELSDGQDERLIDNEE